MRPSGAGHRGASNTQPVSITKEGTNMKSELLRKRLPKAILLLAAMLWTSGPVVAQDYGVGETVNSPVAPNTPPIDGIYEADFWDLGAPIDVMANTDFWNENYPDTGGLAGEGRVLYVQRWRSMFVSASVSAVWSSCRGG